MIDKVLKLKNDGIIKPSKWYYDYGYKMDKKDLVPLKHNSLK